MTDVAGIIYFKTDQQSLQSSASFCWNHTSPPYECLRLNVTKTSADKLTVENRVSAARCAHEIPAIRKVIKRNFTFLTINMDFSSGYSLISTSSKA